jgi:hypothetical protein
MECEASLPVYLKRPPRMPKAIRSNALFAS